MNGLINIPRTKSRKRLGWSSVSRFSVAFLLCFLFLISNSCKINYSFTGASVSPDVKSISIQNFPNNAPLVFPTLSRIITDGLKDYFTTQTSLYLVDRNGDLNIEGSITDYSVQPMAIQGNETAAMNRLTITISVKFTNRKNEKQNFENVTFSRFRDYSSSVSLSSVQDGLVDEISKELVQDVFNKAFVNW